jgi:hypothetical protein
VTGPSSGATGTVQCNEAPAIPKDGRGSMNHTDNPEPWQATGSTQRRTRPTDGKPNDRSRSVLCASYRAGDRLRHW